MAGSAIIRGKNIDPLGFSDDEIDRELAQKSFIDFVRYVKPNYRPAWYHKVICQYLEKWAFGQGKDAIPRLMLFMPVQHGKSELVSRNLPAWIFGRDPEAKIITASYGSHLARKMNRSVQRIMTSKSYAKVFPDSRLFGKNIVTVANDTWLKNADNFEIVDHTGSYVCTGIGGGISGNPMTHGIIDDPYRGRNDAESKAIRERVQSWYDGDFWTRQSTSGEGQANARILLTVTRWKEEDLAGTLLKKAEEDPNNDQWTVLRFPAEAVAPNDYDHRQPGEWLWPERYPESYYLSAKAKSDYDWMSVYQQDPHNDEYAIFNADKMSKISIEEVDLSKCKLYGSLDLSKGGNDFAALVTIAILPDGRWLVWECDLSVDVQSKSITKLIEAQQQYKYQSVWIEANSLEIAKSAWDKGQRSNFEILLRQEQQRAGIVVPYQLVWHTKPKVDRIRSLEGHFNNGQLCFREDWARVYRELINQFRIFPDKNAHDDGPDAIEAVVAGLQNKKQPIAQFTAPSQISSSGIQFS